MTRAQVQAKAETWINNRLAALATRQAIFLANRGRYFQGLFTHSTPPFDGNDVAPDLASGKPHYQEEGWTALFPSGLPATLPVSVRVDAYDGVNGKGYVVIIQVEVVAERIWERAYNFGPEEWRSVGWKRVLEAELI